MCTVLTLNILLQDYSSNHKERTKMDSFHRSWEAILSVEPRAVFIVEPLLFNIFLCDMLLILNTTYFTGYPDDNTPFVVRANIKNKIKALQEIGENLVN